MKNEAASNRLQIHQTLHGYDDGHRLLAASLRLDRSSEASLLVLSDLSGSGGSASVTPYITGYPVESAGLFAIAKTWGAPEKGRPGCVWTHTLLLRKEDLDNLRDPARLLRCFRRPQFGSVETYQVPETIDLTDESELIDSPANVIRSLIYSLYHKAIDEPVVLVTGTLSADASFLRIWGSQWRNLQMTFTFCSGARAPRTLNGRTFDLQATPESSLRRFVKHSPHLIDWAESKESYPGWVLTAADGCLNETESKVRDFVKAVGQHLPPERSLFGPVVRLFEMMQSEGAGSSRGRASRLVEFVQTEFTSSKLRSKLNFVVPEFLTSLSIQEADWLLALAEAKDLGTVYADTTQVRLSASSMWRQEEIAWSCLQNVSSYAVTPMADAVLSGLCEALPRDGVSRLISFTPAVLKAVLSRVPSLALDERLWKGTVVEQSKVAAALADLAMVGERRDTCIATAISAGAAPSRPTLYQAFGGRFTYVLLDWISESPVRAASLRPDWNLAVEDDHQSVTDWLSHQVFIDRAILGLLISTGHLGRVASCSSGRVAIANTANVVVSTKDPNDILVCIKCLRWALSKEREDRSFIAVAVFDSVYVLTMLGVIGERQWIELSDVLPWPYLYQEWDRCGQLRRAVGDRLLSGTWCPSLLSGITSNDDCFAMLVREVRDRWFGKGVLRKALDTVLPGYRRNCLLLALEDKPDEL